MAEGLRADELTYTVGERDLVRDVALTIVPGRIHVIVGPNGAGKSTLLRLLSGELAPSRGTVRCEGEPVGAIASWQLAAMRAVMPQALRIAFPFSAGQVARIGLDGIGRGLDRRARDAILADSLRRADVSHLAHRAYPTLSGGEQARVQFARALCQLAAGRTLVRQQLLFLDEPTASLDLRHQTGLLDVAAELAEEGTAIVAILHDLNLAAAYADALIVMREGRIVARGAPAAVLNDALVAGVFGVPWPVGQIPEGGRPFILPRRSVTVRPQR